MNKPQQRLLALGLGTLGAVLAMPLLWPGAFTGEIPLADTIGYFIQAEVPLVLILYGAMRLTIGDRHA